MEAQEKKNLRVGLWTSVGIHGLIFLVLFFIVAWRAPDPPLPEYGIELNFGLDDQGSGQVQPDQPVGDKGESTETEATDQPTNPEPTEVKEEEKEPVAENAVEQAVSRLESPVTVKEEKKQTTATKETKKTEPTPEKTDATDPKKDVPKVVAPTEAPKKGEPGSQGDSASKTGDKGSAEGKLDASALYGTPGGGGGGTGTNLQMAGWVFADELIIPELPDDQFGFIVLEIECDENGDLTGINTSQRTISPRAEQLIKDVIRKNSLRRTAGGKVAERSTGKITITYREKKK